MSSTASELSPSKVWVKDALQSFLPLSSASILQSRQPSHQNPSALVAFLENEKFLNPRYKTEICRNFKERSKCIYGDCCIFILNSVWWFILTLSIRWQMSIRSWSTRAKRCYPEHKIQDKTMPKILAGWLLCLWTKVQLFTLRTGNRWRLWHTRHTHHRQWCKRIHPFLIIILSLFDDESEFHLLTNSCNFDPIKSNVLKKRSLWNQNISSIDSSSQLCFLYSKRLYMEFL